MTFRKDETGKKYGRLTVLSCAQIDASGRAVWRCRCDCGGEANVVGVDLRRGKTRSCGCFQIDTTSAANRRRAHLNALDICDGDLL